MRDFGERLRAARMSKGLTQDELGRLVGATNQAISNMERGQIDVPKLDNVIALAQALGMGLEELVGFTSVADESEAGTPGEQDEDVLWAASAAGLDADGIKRLRRMRADVGPLDREVLFSVACQIKRNAEKRQRR